MKKLIAVMLALCIVLGLAACTKKAEPMAVATLPPAEAEPTEGAPTDDADPSGMSDPPEDEDPAEDADHAGDEEPTEGAPTGENTGLPEISGVNYDMAWALNGIDYTVNYEDSPMIRLWFRVTNNYDDLRYPGFIFNWDTIMLTQNGEKLTSYLPDEECLEDKVAGCDLYPGTTVEFANAFVLVSDDPVTVSVEREDETIDEYVIEVANRDTYLPEPFEWEHITENDADWFTPVSDEYSVWGDINEKIIGAEVVDGSEWVGVDGIPVVRIYSEITNTTDEEQYVSTDFTPMQDGVELALGTATEAVDTDIMINTTCPAGATITVSQCYVLYNTTSPVFVLAIDSDDNLRGVCYLLGQE